MLIDVMLVLDKLVPSHLLQIGPLAPVRQAIHHVLHEMKAVQVILNPHVESSRDGTFFLVAADVEIAIGPAVVRRCTNEEYPWKPKMMCLSFVNRNRSRFIQSMRMLAARLQPHQIDDIDHPDFQLGKMLPQD